MQQRRNNSFSSHEELETDVAESSAQLIRTVELVSSRFKRVAIFSNSEFLYYENIVVIDRKELSSGLQPLIVSGNKE